MTEDPELQVYLVLPGFGEVWPVGVHLLLGMVMVVVGVPAHDAEVSKL